MELLLFDLVMGFALRFLFLVFWKLARFTVHHLWHGITHHPFITAVLFSTARRGGWLADNDGIVFWTPYITATLLLCAAIRLLSHHPPREIAAGVKRHAKEAQKWGAGVNGAREWVADRRREGRPPPPMPPPTGEATA